ncbi:hypothetical protein PENSPDRAFT_686723 [Peniophora sp. CONT]|nr:hypothetical protein PENSPDRAFT_686723 [Peniophora sp. CONT]
MGVHTLPTELLLITFKLVTEIPPERGDPVTVSIGLSHVCHRWRVLAVSCEEFWAVLPRRSTWWTQLCLSRCPSAPLALDFRAQYAAESDYLAAAQLTYPHFMRAKRVRLMLDDHHNSTDRLLGDVSAAFASFPLATIQDVNIVFRGRAPLGPQGPSHQPLLDTSLIPPTLRSLHIDNCALDTTTTFPSGIRHIEFVNVRPWSSVHLMARFFHNVPQLEYFSLRLTKPGYDMPIDWKSPLPEIRGVNLKHLRGLFLEGPTNQNHVVFSTLAFPSNTSLTLKNSESRPRRSAFSFFHQEPLSEQFQHLVVRSTTALRIHFSDAITRGAHYDAVRLEDHAVKTIHDEQPACKEQWRYSDVLPHPGDLHLEATMHLLHSDDDLHRQSLEAVTSLPIFTQAQTIEFGNDFRWRDIEIAVTAPSAARVVQLESLNATERFTDELQNIEPKDLLPKLECVRLSEIIFNDRDVDLISMNRLVSMNQALIPTLHLLYGKDSGIRIELRRCVMGHADRQSLDIRAHPWPVQYDEYTAPPPQNKPRLPPGIASALSKIRGGRKPKKPL